MPTPEHQRLREITTDFTGWLRWGPYVANRAWATVREDYSADGDAWRFLPHAQARSKAYRWGEDGIAAICDRYQILVFAPAFWNRRDEMLKERLFGLTFWEGNHGEDVKEAYFYLDSTPTHSYMKFLYKYAQAAFPYEMLVAENRRRQGQGREFELADGGLFDTDAYFDIFVEYAKATPEDWCIRIEAINRGSTPAPLDLIPQLWFRNTWAWYPERRPEPSIALGKPAADFVQLVATDADTDPLPKVPVEYRLGLRSFYGPPGGRALFTDNETHAERVFGPGYRSQSAFVKDAFHRHIIQGEPCTNPAQRGTKAAVQFRFAAVAPGGTAIVRLRLSDRLDLSDPLGEVDNVIALRRKEADEYYASLAPPHAAEEERRVQRQALAGLLWTKQCYLFDVEKWLHGDFADSPPPAARGKIRNQHWPHLNSMRVMTVPDKWEYPWFAAWDLAFQCVPLAMVDPWFAKQQLTMLLFEQFQHPNGQIPAYEWEFSDSNPPVHAWAVWRVYLHEKRRQGMADRAFLERCFHKLLINFAWWINKVDREGNNLFEGGFLGLDNITVADRSVPFPGGAVLEQADATGWMGMFCLHMMRIALELALENPVYENLAVKFFQHYVYVAAAMKHMGNRNWQLWDEEDGFFYDVLRHPNNEFHKFRVRSLVGLIPLFAVERLQQSHLAAHPEFARNVNWFLRNRRELIADVVHTVEMDGQTTHVLTIVNQEQIRRILTRVLDPAEFLSPFGIRSLSKFHEEHPFVMDGQTVGYEPGEAASKIKGGNSNWRGPIWFPTTFMLIESLRKLGQAYGPTLTLPLDGQRATLLDVARELVTRLIAIFLPGADGRRPVHGQRRAFRDNPHWRDLLLFYEYFHGDTGEGLGASHQTGWTALVASLIDEWRR